MSKKKVEEQDQTLPIKSKKKDYENNVKEIEDAMYKMAIGFKYKQKKHMKVKTIEYKDGKKIKEVEELQEYIDEGYIPPNVTVGMFLLKNWSHNINYSTEPNSLKLKEKEYKLREDVLKW